MGVYQNHIGFFRTIIASMTRKGTAFAENSNVVDGEYENQACSTKWTSRSRLGHQT